MVDSVRRSLQSLRLVERDSEEERIPKRFEIAQPFSDGLAAVRIDGRYGYIDTTGKIVIAPQFEAGGPFSGEYAEVQVEGRSGAIDRTGRIVVPTQFDRLIPFTAGAFIGKPLAPGQQRSSEHPRLDGEVQLEGLASKLVTISLGNAGIYHLRKGWLTDAALQFHFFDEPARGLIWAGRRNAQNDEQWGLLRADGTWQVTPRYGHVQFLSETHAVVSAMPDYSKPWRERSRSTPVGAVDKDGKLVVPLELRGLSYWRGGYASATQWEQNPEDGSWSSSGAGIMQGDGKLLAGRWFDEVDIREDGKLPRGRIGDTWHSIEPNGRLVADELEGTAYIECPSGLKFVHRGDMLEVQRPKDNKPTGRFEQGVLRSVDCPGPFSGKRNNMFFFILEDGTVLGEPNGFEDSYGFSGTYAAVKVAGKWGVIDRSGAFTVKPRFRDLRTGARDKFVVGVGKKVAWIDGKGAWIKAPNTKRPPTAETLSCEGGLRFFSADGLWGLQDSDGKTVIEPRYRALTCFRQGVSWTASPESKEWCPIGPAGERREALKCRKTHYPMIVTHHYPERFSDDDYESSVLWSRALLDYKAGARAERPRWLSDDEGPASYSVIPN